MLVEGLKLTLLVGITSMLIAVFLGLLGSWAKLSSSCVARFIAETYTFVIRGIPELILLLLVYFGLPTIIQHIAARFGHDIIVNINPFTAGTVTIGFIYGAFCTEVFRGAFQAIPKGQKEAAIASGLNQWQRFRLVLFPQAIRFALPGLGNVWMILIKATALVSIIQLDELMRMAKIASGATHQPFTFYFLASLLFLLITVVSMWLQHRAEKWSNRGYNNEF